VQGWSNIPNQQTYTALKYKQGQGSQNYANRYRKAFDKIQHLFMTKGLGIEGSCLNIIKAIFVLGWVGDAED
jgi:hypothetical protein